MLPSWVGSYIGIPFVSGGRTREGCDCYGLVRLVLRERFGYELPLLSGEYASANCSREIEPVLRAQIPLLSGERIQRPEPGAVAVMRFCGSPTHVGVFVSEEYILHTLLGAGAHCARPGTGGMRGSVEGIYRVGSCYSVHSSV